MSIIGSDRDDHFIQILSDLNAAGKSRIRRLPKIISIQGSSFSGRNRVQLVDPFICNFNLAVAAFNAPGVIVIGLDPGFELRVSTTTVEVEARNIMLIKGVHESFPRPGSHSPGHAVVRHHVHPHDVVHHSQSPLFHSLGNCTAEILLHSLEQRQSLLSLLCHLA